MKDDAQIVTAVRIAHDAYIATVDAARRATPPDIDKAIADAHAEFYLAVGDALGIHSITV